MLLNTINLPNQFVAQAVNHVAIYQNGVVSIHLKNKLRADFTQLPTTYAIEGVRSIAISPNGEYVCVQTKTQTIRLRAGVRTPFSSVGPFSISDTGQIVMVNVSGGAVQVIEDSTTNLTVAVTDDDRVVCAAGRYMVYNRVRTITAQYADLVLTPVASAKQIVNVSHDNNGKFIIFYADGTMLYDGQTKTPVLPFQGFRGLGDQLITTDYKNEYVLNRWRPYARPEFVRPFKWRVPSPLNALSADTLMLVPGDGVTNATFDKLGLQVAQQGGITIANDAPYGTSGKSFQFNGTSSYIQTVDHANWQLGTRDFTIKINVKIVAIADTFSFIYNKGGTGNLTAATIVLRAMKATKAFRLSMANAYAAWDVADVEFGAFEYGEWNQVVITRSGSKIRCFQNGKLLATVTSSTSLNPFAGLGVQLGHCRIANFNTGTLAYMLNGNIHNFQLLNYAEHRTDYYAECYPETYQLPPFPQSFFVTDAPITYTFTKTNGVTLENPATIGTDTVILASGNQDTLDIKFSQALNLSTSDWTLEWSSQNLEAAAGYCAHIALLPETGAFGITARYGDDGFSNRLQFGGLISQPSQIFNVPFNKTTLLNALRKYTMVKQGQNISVYVDSIKQDFAVGTSQTYDTATFAPDADITAIKRVRLGNISSGGSTLSAKHGPVKLTMSAKPPVGFTVFNNAGTLSPLLTNNGGASVSSGVVNMGNNQYLSMATNPTLVPGTGDFEIEMEVYFNAMPAAVSGYVVQPLLFWGTFATTGQPINFDICYIHSSGTPRLTFGTRYDSATTHNMTYNTTMATGRWYSLRWRRTAGVLKLIMDGTEVMSVSYPHAIDYDTAQPIYIGRRLAGSAGEIIWYSNMQVRKFQIKIG
uniref:Tail fiber protein n=1 Tax=Pseudomonas phage HRDY3 TaxID=3236930 RepID=A0AB39CDF8_9VIRU